MSDLPEKWTIIEGLLVALSLFMADKDKLSASDFREYLDNREFGLALRELASVVST